jgi:hypothetical protein
MSLSVQNIGPVPAWGQASGSTSAGLTFTSGVYVPGSTIYVAGYLDGENRSKLFFTDGSSIAVPTLTQITEVSIVDSAGNTKTGGFYVELTYAAGSPDATSANGTIFLDEFALLIESSTAYGK